MDGEGKPAKFVYQHIYDGQPHTTTGIPVYDSSTYTRVGNTLNAVRFKSWKVAAVGQVMIVPGKTYTFNEEGIDPNNQPYHYFYVYDRQ